MDPVIKVALIAAIAPTLVAFVTLVLGLVHKKKLEEIHIIVNSRLTELLAVSKKAAHEEGRKEGQADGDAPSAPVVQPVTMRDTIPHVAPSDTADGAD